MASTPASFEGRPAVPDRWVNPHGWGPQQPNQPPAQPPAGSTPPPAARAAARMGTTTAPAATNATAVGRTTSAAAPLRPPLVPEGADHHPFGGCRTVVPAWPGGVGRQATDSTRQHRRSPGSLD